MPSITGSDITQAASSYSAVAGILAGFGFAVLVFLVERLSPEDQAGTADDATLRALVLLGITFLGNVLVSFFWAVIAGEVNVESNRPGVMRDSFTRTRHKTFTYPTLTPRAARPAGRTLPRRPQQR